MPPTICVVYRHQYGCPNGECPNHIAIVRDRGDAERTIQTITTKHPERPVALVRVSEL